MGRKRKIPEGYIPKWKTDSDSTDSENELHASQCHQRLDIDNAGDFPIQSRGNLDIPPIKSRKLSSDHVFANPITEESENIPGPQKEEQPEQIHTEEVQLEAHNESTDNEECLLHDLPLQEDAQQESPTYKYQADQLLPEDELSLCEDEDEEDGLYMEEDMEDLPLQEDVLPEALTDEFQADQHLPEDELPFSEEEEEEEDDEEEEEEKEEEEEENKESFLYILKQFAEEWMGSEVNKRVSKRASSSLWNVAAKWMFQLTTAFVKDKKKKFPKLTHVRRKLVKKHVPPISLDTGFVNKETNELTLFSNSETTPSLDPQLHEKVFEIASIKTEDIVKIQAKVCPNFSKNIKISLDGISEAKSNIISLDVYSSKFNRCRNIFPHRLVRPLKKEFVENQEQLKKFLCDICDNSLTIDCAVGDNPKRSDFRLCLNHSALYACEYCFAKAVRITNKKSKSENPDISKTLILERIKKLEQTKNPKNSKTIKILKKIVADLDKHKVSKCRQMTVWPSSTANQELRSKDSILQIVESIENHDSEDEPLSRDDVKGVIGRSLFLNIDYFDFVTSIPAEYMHLLCLGTVKRLTELTFNVGINRTRVTKRKLSSTKDFNLLMAQTKVFFESSRRARDLDFSVYKAEEFRNLILFFFPHVLSCVEETACERQLWLYLAFMVRSCIIPDNEFFNVNVSQITLACQKFYKLFEKTFGVTNCAYSLHVLCCHLLQIRQLGPLTETSAFLFESFYGELRNSFVPGTPAPLKQILENVFLKRAITPHSCEKSIYLTNYDTAKQSNSLIYTYEKDNINMYKVLDQIDGEVICNPQGKFVCEFTETPELSWSSVGVFKKGATTDEVIKLPHKAIAGKVLKVGLYLITCPENVLKEK